MNDAGVTLQVINNEALTAFGWSVRIDKHPWWTFSENDFKRCVISHLATYEAYAQFLECSRACMSSKVK